MTVTLRRVDWTTPDGVRHWPGEIIELEDSVANDLIRSKRAEAVTADESPADQPAEDSQDEPEPAPTEQLPTIAEAAPMPKRHGRNPRKS